MSTKGHNFVQNLRNVPVYNPKQLLLNINTYAKFKKNRKKYSEIENS